MGAFRFKHLELGKSDFELEQCPFLAEAVNKAEMSFRVEVSYTKDGASRSYDMRQARVKEAAKQVVVCISQIEKLIAKHLKGELGDECWADDVDHQWQWGEHLIDVMQINSELGNDPLQLCVRDLKFNERQLLAAALLRQCEVCTAAYIAGDATAVGHLMWDIHMLICELHHEDDREEQEEVASYKSQLLNRKRHAKRDEAKALVLADWENEKNRFPSANKAGAHYADWLRERGHEFEPITVRDWIRGHAKKLGVRFR